MSASDVPDHDDVVLLLEACASRLGDDVLARVRSECGDDIRYRDGYVFQHLLTGPKTISELANRLGVTQQAMSKQVGDLLRRDLVVKHRDPADGRAWLVSLGERGHAVIDAGRRARSSIAQQLVDALGADSMQRLVEDLLLLSEETGAMEHLMSRRLRPEDVR
ncbi:MAG: MarR family transcriptional regulator [Actinomycetota bacterium]